MKKGTTPSINIAIIAIVIIGFSSIILITMNTYNKILEDDVENVSKLTASNIYAEIDNELTKPIYVAQTMANDTFMKEWIKGEQANMGNSEYSDELQEYLMALKLKYNYDSVFLVSSKSNVYYYFEGVNKVISPENKHDIWYYDFLKEDKLCDLDVDADEANNNALTVFVNCRVEDEDGSLMGVVGVGVKMSELQEMLQSYESEFDLQAYLINENGTVQVHTNSDKIETVNVFDMQGITELKDSILGNKTTMEIHWYPAEQSNHCLITQYVDNLSWHLVVEKDTLAIRKSFEMMILQDILIVAIILLLLLTLATYIIKRYNCTIKKLATTDPLTGLKNRNSFTEIFDEDFDRGQLEGSFLFVIDIDSFKEINDTKGHLFGDAILFKIAHVLENVLRDSGSLARWGGDEFVGIIYAKKEQGQNILQTLARKSSEIDTWDGKHVTISIGVTAIENEKTLNDLLGEADKALYISKENGKNQTTYFQDIAAHNVD